MDNKKTNYTAARERANKKWAENNKERRRYLSYRSSARAFIKHHAVLEDLAELESLMREREQKLTE